MLSEGVEVTAEIGDEHRKERRVPRATGDPQKRRVPGATGDQSFSEQTLGFGQHFEKQIIGTTSGICELTRR